MFAGLSTSNADGGTQRFAGTHAAGAVQSGLDVHGPSASSRVSIRTGSFAGCMPPGEYVTVRTQSDVGRQIR
jgi:hypothetical protein